MEGVKYFDDVLDEFCSRREPQSADGLFHVECGRAAQQRCERDANTEDKMGQDAGGTHLQHTIMMVFVFP